MLLHKRISSVRGGQTGLFTDLHPVVKTSWKPSLVLIWYCRVFALHLQLERSRPSTCTIYRTAPRAHLLPVKPLAHWHCPVSGSHLPRLWHTHSSAQFGPNRPSGHRCVQTGPCRKVRGKTGRDVEKMQRHHFKNPGNGHELMQ